MIEKPIFSDLVLFSQFDRAATKLERRLAVLPEIHITNTRLRNATDLQKLSEAVKRPALKLLAEKVPGVVFKKALLYRRPDGSLGNINLLVYYYTTEGVVWRWSADTLGFWTSKKACELLEVPFDGCYNGGPPSDDHFELNVVTSELHDSMSWIADLVNTEEREGCAPPFELSHKEGYSHYMKSARARLYQTKLEQRIKQHKYLT